MACQSSPTSTSGVSRVFTTLASARKSLLMADAAGSGARVRMSGQVQSILVHHAMHGAVSSLALTLPSLDCD